MSSFVNKTEATHYSYCLWNLTDYGFDSDDPLKVEY